MNFVRLLARVELRAIVAVFLVDAAVASYVYVSSMLSPASILWAPATAKIFFVAAAMLGLPAAALVGAPAYAILKFKRLASWPAVLVVGALSGASIFVATRVRGELGMYIGCGVAVASLTHLMLRTVPPSTPNERRGNAP